MNSFRCGWGVRRKLGLEAVRGGEIVAQIDAADVTGGRHRSG